MATFDRAITFQVFHGAEGLTQIRDDWDDVVCGINQPRYFHLFSWYDSFVLKLCRNPASLRFFVGYSDGRPIAVFPLYSGQRSFGGLPVRTLEFASHAHLPISDFVFDKTETNSRLVASLVEFLQRERSRLWDVLVIEGVLEDSAAWFSLSSCPPHGMLSQPQGRCDYLDNTPMEKRLAGLSKNFRGALRKARNKLAKETGVEFVRSENPNESAGMLEEFIDVEASGWKGKDGTAIKSDAHLAACYRELCAAFSRLSACEINLLRLDGKCIAGQFCLKVSGCLYILKIGYDEAHSKLAPGNMLLEHVIRRSASCDEVDTINLVSAAAWHADWNPQSYPKFDAFVFNRTLPGRLSQFTMLTKSRLRPFYQRYGKPWLKRSLQTIKANGWLWKPDR